MTLAGIQAPPPEPVGPGAVQGQGAAPVQEAVVQPRQVGLVLGQQQEVVTLEAELGQAGVNERVPAATGGETGDAGGPGADGVVGNAAGLV